MPSDSVKIIPADSSHVKEMTLLLMSAWHRNYGAAGEFYSAQQFTDPNYETQTGPYASVEQFVQANAESIENRLKPPFSAWLVHDGSNILGYAICEHTKHGVWVNDVVVSPEHHREGIGRTLFEHIVEQHRGKKMWIWVNANNPAVDFWKKMGFKEVLKEVLMKRD